jgi:cbb3-type cytochrome oxidase subunit 3
VKQAFLAPLANSPLLVLPLLALFLFLFVFAAWVIRTYGKRAEAYAELEALPLCDDVARIAQKTPTDEVREVHHGA